MTPYDKIRVENALRELIIMWDDLFSNGYFEDDEDGIFMLSSIQQIYNKVRNKDLIEDTWTSV